MAERRTAITNEPVGARLGRLFQRNRTQEERDVLEAYRRQVPVDEIRRRRAAAEAPAPSPVAEARREDSESPTPAPTAPADEAAAALRQRQEQRQPRRNNNRFTAPRPASSGMSEAEIRNQRELDRIRAEREAEESRPSVAQRAESIAQMGGSGDIGAASARARGEQVGPPGDYNMKKGGAVKKMAKGGVVKKMATGGASRRGDGCAARGKTKGRMV